MDAIECYKKENKILKIWHDNDTSDPREFCDITKMVCFHRNYNLGDKHDYNKNDYDSWDELKQAIIKNEKVVAIAPLYLYDHSGLRIKIGNFQGLLPQGHAEFDTCCVGFIYVTMDKLNKECGFKKRTKKAIAQAEEWMKDDVETYDMYVSGDVYGFSLIEIDEDGKEINITDSCGGFYGSNIKKNGILDNAGITLEEFEKDWNEVREVKRMYYSYSYE